MIRTFVTFFVCLFVILGSFTVTPSRTFAQTATANPGLSQADQEAQWRAELAQTEADITKWQGILDSTKKGTASLQRDANILTAKINEAKAFIKARNIAIAQLGQAITVKTATIETLQQRISNSQDSVAQLIRKANELDAYSLPDVILARKNLSDFFSDADSFITINRSLKELLDQITTTKHATEEQKQQLAHQQDQQLNIKATVEAQKAKVESDEKQKQYLITVNKTQEKTYQQVISDQQKKAAQIRAALFALAGGTSAIPFGDAYKYALEAQKATGIRPAFLLAILTQETNLGKNVGTCNKADSPANKKWNVIMPGPNDVASGASRRDDQSAYLRITQALGLSPESKPLSCPIGGTGWGGAMGPSQFIPTTWESYAPRVATALGESVTNPWSPEDAFTASSIYLTDLGAGTQTFTAERTAALKYYAGSNWNKKANAFYGDQVMTKAQSIQTNMIDLLNI